MSEYFAGIAARNCLNPTHLTMPSSDRGSLFPMNRIESSFEDPFATDTTSPFVQPLALGEEKRERTTFAQSTSKVAAIAKDNILHPSQHTTINKVTIVSNSFPYLERHIERTGNYDNNLKSDSSLEVSKRISELSTVPGFEKRVITKGTILKPGSNTENLLGRSDQKIVNENDSKEESQWIRRVDSVPGWSINEPTFLNKLVPFPPVQQYASNASHTNNADKNKSATAKLVIGKIIIEVLPPPSAPPPKISKSNTQQATNSNNTKVTRLSFGLGQM